MLTNNKCEWCKKNAEKLINHKDSLGNVSHICENCNNTVMEHKCRKCNCIIDAAFEFSGLCANCYQAHLYEVNKKKEEVRMGVDSSIVNELTSELSFSDKEYEQWVTMGKTYSHDDVKNSRELRRIWIMVKLNATGIYDGEIISKNFKDIEALLDRNLSKLVNKKCKIIIGNSPETRALIRQSNVLDMENEVVIALD